MRNELMKYVRRNPKIRMMYIDSRDNITIRTVRVLRINNSCFIAYCYLRGEKRTFKVNNILAVVSDSVERAVV